MNRRAAHTGLALATRLLPCFATGASAGMQPEGFKDSIVSSAQAQPVERPFKLKGGGQIDLDTFGFDSAGTATHLGMYTSTGAIDPSTFQIQGTMTAANGDTLDWSAQFAQGPLGEIEATFTVTGGTGRFAGASGSASGPVALDPDYSFTLKLEGTITY
jgi:hypothetical protein